MSSRLLVNRNHLIVYGRRSIMHPCGIRLSYASKGGGLVPRYRKNPWKDINGIHINSKWLSIWLLFRRTGA